MSEDGFEQSFESDVKAMVGVVELKREFGVAERVVMGVAIAVALCVGIAVMVVARGDGVRIDGVAEDNGLTMEVVDGEVAPIVGRWVCEESENGIGDGLWRDVGLDFRADGSFMMYVFGEEFNDGLYWEVDAFAAVWQAEFDEMTSFAFRLDGHTYGVMSMGVDELKCVREGS